MITLEMLCSWLEAAKSDIVIKITQRNGYIYLETDTAVYRVSLDTGI